ncbi:MAG TPA: hypothetical protein VGD42_01315 [Lysobacter sp.]
MSLRLLLPAHRAMLAVVLLLCGAAGAQPRATGAIVLAPSEIA